MTWDTPMTPHGLSSGTLEYLRREQIAAFDLYLSFPEAACCDGSSKNTARAYPASLRLCAPGCLLSRRRTDRACSLSYVGTYEPDRQKKLNHLFL